MSYIKTSKPRCVERSKNTCVAYCYYFMRYLVKHTPLSQRLNTTGAMLMVPCAFHIDNKFLLKSTS